MVSRTICGGLIGLAVLAGSVSAQTVLYVDVNATDPPDGSSWCTAYRTLDEALAVAGADTVIRVADGTYMPDPSGLSNPREATFQLLNGVTIEGGYAGSGAPDPDARDIAAYETVLSGDIGVSDDSADNCYHVVTGSDTDATAVLDGVTITGGNADGASPHNNGGGMLNEGGSPTVNRCTFSLNSAVNVGGGMQNYGGDPMLTNCAFSGNTAGYGGGVNNGVGSASTLVSCTFSGNAADNHGGGLRNWESSPKLINCTFAGNSAQTEGGGIYNRDNNPAITNCILWANAAASGAQIHNSGGASPSVTYSCIQGGWLGEGNIDADPAFLRDPNAGGDGLWGTDDDDYGDLNLTAGSPCLDVGINTTNPPLPDTDADGGPRIISGVVDMGAYEADRDGFAVTPWLVEVVEGGAGEFTVALVDDPNAVVSVDVSFVSGDSDISVATAMPLSFDSSNYWIAQPVTLTGAEDTDQLQGSAVFTVTAIGLRPGQVVACEIDNDTPPPVLHVDAAATGAADGTNWTDAYPQLHDALIVASRFPQLVEQIRIADGTYAPDPSGLADLREATIQLLDGLTIEGGYAGSGAPDPDARDITLYETVLSGDIGTLGDNTDNCYHVVTGSGTDATAVLDGVTITGGNADGASPHNNGGGMLNNPGSPTVNRCTFSLNSAANAGGGMHNYVGSPTVTNCTFKGNTAGYGGGVDNGEGTTITLVNCTFAGNAAGNDGGGMRNLVSSPILLNCTFSRNHAFDGGGLHNYACNPVLTNCILWGNTAVGNPQIRNDDYASVSVTYSCVEGGWAGEGNIDADPMFVRDPSAGVDATWGTPDDDYGDLHLACDSPCVDAGTNTTSPSLPPTDVDGNPRTVSGVVDMGPYEAECNAFAVVSWLVEVPEGQSAVFTVALADDPNGPVSVDVSVESGDADIAVATPMPLAFDSSNYWVAQPVTLTGAEDSDQLEGSAVLALTASGLRAAQVVAREVENDVPSVLYVDTSATGADDGTSWTDAYPELSDALALAAGAPLVVDDIRVADGTYTPDPSGLADPREATFQLLNGVTIEGGYAGCGAADPDVRDIATYETVLSGDIDGAANCYHVVTGSGTDATAVLDGVTITGGRAPYPHDTGAGMFNKWGSPTVEHCTFTDNVANSAGSGMYNYFSSPTVTHCTFTFDGGEASTSEGGGMYNYLSSPTVTDCVFTGYRSTYGGGVYNEGGTPTFTQCTFSQNAATFFGGGMYNYGSNPTLTDCNFSSNRVSGIPGSPDDYPGRGGGMHNYASSPTLTNCSFTSNSAKSCSSLGAGMYNRGGGQPQITNCTFTGNVANDGGGIFNEDSSPTLTNSTLAANSAAQRGGALYNDNSNPTLTNCIVWGNAALTGGQIDACCGGSVSITYSCVPSFWAGEGNIHVDPAFVRDPDVGPDGEWGTGDDDYGDLHLTPGSPCVDAGDPNGDYTGQTDMDGEPRVMDGRVDMGADECSGVARLVASGPPDGGTLPKTQANVIRLTFSWAIALPTGPALQIEPVGGGADVGDQFGYSLETTSAADDSLKAFEVGSVLVNLTWYRVTPAAGFDVEPFALDLCVLVGDANGSGRITTADYAEIKAHMGEYTDARYDLNGSGRVTTADYSVVKAHMAERVPTKP